jgi:hypothetical protein
VSNVMTQWQKTGDKRTWCAAASDLVLTVTHLRHPPRRAAVGRAACRGGGQVNDSKRMPRWPLAVIAAPAAVAVWSGWVGLGAMCGFGIIHPLPGIWDSFQINTAITLPVGVEAYGAYALAAWLKGGVSQRARKFAKRSALGALALGMAGQVAFHMLTAAHATRAPWAVVMLVACLPVVVMGLGAALVHLLREPADEVPAAVTIPAPAMAGRTVTASVPEIEPATAPQRDIPTLPPTLPKAVTPVRAQRRAPRRASRAPERVFAAELEQGELPSLRAIKSRAKCGTDRARAIREQLSEILREHVSEAA